MANGNSMYACVFIIQDEKVVVYYEYESMRNHIKTEIKRWGVGPEGGRLFAERMTINGARYTDPSAPSLRAATCPEECQSMFGEQQVTTCSSIGVGCITTSIACAGCGYACAVTTGAGAGPLCFFCLAATCPNIVTTCCRTTCTVCAPCAPPGP